MSLRLTAWLAALFLASSFSASADQIISSPVVTIKKVDLKNLKGEWITVIEPDRHVNPLQKELGLTFINNGRVPEDQYVNFRITLSEFQNRQSKEDEARITLKSDLELALHVTSHSFIGIWVHLNWRGDMTSSDVKDAAITIDDATQTLAGDKFHFLKSSGLVE